MITSTPDLQQEFEALRSKPDAEKLAGLRRLRETFRTAGHNPADVHDPMYSTLGVSKDFFDLVVSGLEQRIR